MNKRLFIKVKRESLPQLKDRYPFIYLERGRLEVDDSSIKWIDSEGAVVRIPCAVLSSILLGPGTSVTHEAIKVMAAANCLVSWVGEDAMIYYAAGQSPVSETRKLRRQAELSSSPKKSLEVARRLFLHRFEEEALEGKTLKEMMGLEGRRTRELYDAKANEYGVGWRGRSYVPGKFELSDITNRILTAANAALYGIVSSAVHCLGYSPHLGFIHSGSPLPFVYDIADMYKDHLCIDLAFKMSRELGGTYDRSRVAAEFRTRVLDDRLLERLAPDISEVLGEGK
jgi:CRISPR-associated protein Cas1